MRLLSCHIASFGKLNDTTFDFSEGLTVLKADNSFGKTTLANFITSMFYGLPDNKVQSLTNDRRRYEPWQGSIYGGSLMFSYRDKRYMVRRDFNKKGDAFALTDVTESIKKDVDQLDGKQVDGTNFGDILFGIGKSSFKRSAYVPQDEIICGELESGLGDKLRNLVHATSETHNFQKSLDALQKAADTIESKRGKGKLKEIDERIGVLQGKITECEVCFDNAESGRKRWKERKRDLLALDADIAVLDEQIRSQNEAETRLAQKRHYDAIRTSIQLFEEKLARLTPFFRQGIEGVNPDGIREKILEFRTKEKELRDSESCVLTERSKLLSLEEAHLARQERRKMLYAQAAGFKSDKARVSEEKERHEIEKKHLQAQTKRKGAAFILLCVVTFGLYLIWSNNKIKQLSKSLDSARQSAAECEAKLLEYDRQIAAITAEIDGIDASPSVDSGGRLNEMETRLQAVKAQAEAAEQVVRDAFVPFDCSGGDYAERYHEVKDKYKSLMDAKRELKEKRMELEAFLADKDESLFTAPAQTDGALAGLQQRRSAADQQRISLIREISDIEIRFMQDEEKADDISDYASELSFCKETKDRLTAELVLLKKTALFLNEANERLANQYLVPLLETSSQLIRLYDKQKSGLGIDANSKLRIEENGKDRELDYFSKGIKELVSICMRIALTDLIFQDGEKRPCLILDDPFVNLDDQKLRHAKDLIQSLAKTYQIIYLTCHDSRNITV